MIYYLGQKPLLLEDFILYIYIGNKKDGKVINIQILEREAKYPLTLSLLQLYLDIYVAESFYIILVKSSKSRFATNPGFSNIKHICHYSCAIISIEKDIGFSPSFYCLDTLSPLVLMFEIIDKVAYHYFYFFLKRANVFHIIRIKQEIV